MATVIADLPLAGVPLDDDQQKAANHRIGRACVSASAGSGKTTLLVGRAIALVEAGEAPQSILTLAFNKNAQLTLVKRLSENPATAGSAQQMASTFHAFAYQCLRLVMPSLQVLGVSAEEGAKQERRGGGADVPRLTAYDLGKRVWDSMGGNVYGAMRPEIVKGTDLDEVMHVESGARERLFTAGWPNAFFKTDGSTSPEQRTKLSAALRALQLRDVSPDVLTALVEFMPGYRRERQAAGSVDFTDMLLGLGNFIRKGDEKVMTRLRQIKHLQVDEAQDGNELRWYIAQTVADFGGERSVMAVGDLRQSIAGFAGAQPAMFKEWWDKADAQFSLPNNYRSASAIVAAGNAVARGEPWSIGKDAIAARADLGMGSVRVDSVGTLGIANEISTAIAAGLGHKDVTVLARTKAALEQVAFGLRTKGLKVFVRGGGHVWKGMDGRMIRAMLDFSEGSMRDQKALGLALNKPKRYVSPALLTNAQNGRGPWFDRNNRLNHSQLARDAGSYPPARAVRDAYDTLSNLIWADRVAQVESWLLEGMDADQRENAQAPDSKSDKADLIKSLCEIAAVCGDVKSLDLAIDAETKLDPKDPDVIELSTIHMAKGDQWSVVYVTGVKEGIFPHMKATDEESLAEEVRLLYVAVTRPVHTLVVDVTDAVRFAKQIAALDVVAASTTPPPPPSPPQPPKRTTEPSSEPLVTFPETPERPTKAPSPHGMMASLLSDDERAHALTAAGVQPAKDTRFVPVRWDELTTLLSPHGFVEDVTLARRYSQRMLVANLNEGSQVLVYTSVPPGQPEARGIGEDSIKVVVLSPAGKPYSHRMPYTARTRNWRVTLLQRISDALMSHPDVKTEA